MSDATFDHGWLRLREPVDHRSRAAELDARLRRYGTAHSWTHVVDLGGGSGSNVRYLGPRLPWATRWTVVDRDAALLAHVTEPRPGTSIQVLEADLGVGGSGLAAIDDADVVTASALLDLVSRSWLDALASRCANRPRGVLLALSVDGTIAWHAPDPLDALLVAAFNRHQSREKGLGQALGPRAAHAAREAFEAAGFEVHLAASPWVLAGSGDAELAIALLGGWRQAASEAAPERRVDIHDWATRRADQIRDGDYQVSVGHIDLLALPPAP